MSDFQRGPGWWQASDGKWYPPETHPSRQAPPPPPAAPHAQVPPPGSGFGLPSYPDNPTQPGTPSPYTQWGTPYAPYGVPPGPQAQTNGLAIASLACSVGGVIPFFFGIPCVVGIILGFVALGQLKRRTGQRGRGLARAGIIVGFGLIVLFVALIVAVGVSRSSS